VSPTASNRKTGKLKDIFTRLLKSYMISLIVICSRNRSKIPYLVPNPGNYYPVFHHDRTKYHQFWPVFASIHDVKQHCSSMYFRLHIHKHHHSITRRNLVTETTNIISCDAPTPQAVVFVTYLDQMEFETGSGYPGNCNQVHHSKRVMLQITNC